MDMESLFNVLDNLFKLLQVLLPKNKVLKVNYDAKTLTDTPKMAVTISKLNTNSFYKISTRVSI